MVSLRIEVRSLKYRNLRQRLIYFHSLAAYHKKHNNYERQLEFSYRIRPHKYRTSWTRNNEL